MAENFTSDSWYEYVHSEAFNKECNVQSTRLSSSSRSSERINPFEKDDDSTGVSSVESRHNVSKLEASLYYFGIRGLRHLGPKLIYRTSTDVFRPPSGPAQDARIMQLLPANHDKLRQDGLWATIRPKIVELLDERAIQLTSVDLARFRWEEEKTDGPSQTVTSHDTVWVGVQPDSLNANVAYESSRDILRLLESYGIADVDIAYRESVARFLSGPELFAPVNDVHPLKDVIDPVTTALGMPIAGLKTPHMKGTLGFFFRVGDALYGVTARHVLFPEEGGNAAYSYVAGPKKEVVLMSNRDFDDFLAHIRDHISILNGTVLVLEKQVVTFGRRAEAGNQQAAIDLEKIKAELTTKQETIEELKAFLIKMKKEWSGLNDRVIGYVEWAPPISGSNPPHNYTKDVCVIKLDEKKLMPNFKGNVIDLGPEIDPGKFMYLIHPRDDVPSEFDYPVDRLFELGPILSAAQIATPNSRDINDEPARFVIKRGLTTRTTIGRLTGFESHVRRYSPLGTFDSVETAIYPFNNDFGPFSRGGDSGAIIAGALAEFAALLTSSTGLIDSSDITFGTPMHWLWDDVIKVQYPRGDLYFDIPKN